MKVDAQDDESYGDFSGALPTCWWPSVISKQRWKYLIPGMISHVQLSTSTYCSSSLLGPRLITIHYMYNNIKMFLSLAVFRYFAFVLAQINMSLECACHIKYWPLKWQDLDGWSSQVPKMTPELINTRIFTLVFGFCLGLLFYPLLTTHLTKVWINTHTHILIHLYDHWKQNLSRCQTT